MGYATTVPVSSRLVSLVTMLHAPSTHPSSVAHVIKVSWSVWVPRTPTSVMKLNPREVSLPSSTQSNTVSSLTGMIWKRSGTTPSTSQPYTSVSKPSSPSTLPVVPLVSSLTLVMVSPTTSQSTKVMPYHTPS